ncbi:hypothetical protein [Subtercola sp. YIM 133946]|uniref:hypothetical protein n=1 Tax=Subtercola sp. YIM 133946 TaxID=3118909 RepID=UPI002F926B15
MIRTFRRAAVTAPQSQPELQAGGRVPSATPTTLMRQLRNAVIDEAVISTAAVLPIAALVVWAASLSTR